MQSQNMITEFQKLKGNEVLIAMVAFLAVVGPGFLTIYHYHPELVKELDVVKLLVFSASLSGPLVFGNMLFLIAASGKQPDSPKKGPVLLLACLLTIPLFYGTLLFAWFVHAPFVVMVKYLLILYVLLGVLVAVIESKKPEPPTPKNEQ